MNRQRNLLYFMFSLGLIGCSVHRRRDSFDSYVVATTYLCLIHCDIYQKQFVFVNAYRFQLNIARSKLL